MEAGSTSSSSLSSSVVSPASRTSAVWKYFGFAKDDARKLVKDSCAICKQCGQKVAHGGGTTNLKKHLRSKHRLTYDELFTTTVLEKEQRSLDVFVRLVAVKKLPPHSDRTVQLTDAVADFIAHDLRPVSVVDGDGFLQLLSLAM